MKLSHYTNYSTPFEMFTMIGALLLSIKLERLILMGIYNLHILVHSSMLPIVKYTNVKLNTNIVVLYLHQLSFHTGNEI